MPRSIPGRGEEVCWRPLGSRRANPTAWCDGSAPGPTAGLGGGPQETRSPRPRVFGRQLGDDLALGNWRKRFRVDDEEDSIPRRVLFAADDVGIAGKV